MVGVAGGFRLARNAKRLQPSTLFAFADLIRIFLRYLHLSCTQPPAHNNGTLRSAVAATAVPQTHNVGGPMGKMAIFLGGFLVLTILIGALATISPT